MVNDPARCRCPLSVQSHCCQSTSKPTGPQQVALSDSRTDIAGVCPQARLSVRGHSCLSTATAVHIKVVTLDGGADLTVGRTYWLLSTGTTVCPRALPSVHGHSCLSTGTAVHVKVVTLDGGADLTVGRTLLASVHGHDCLSTGTAVCPRPRLSIKGMAVCPRALLSRW